MYILDLLWKKLFKNKEDTLYLASDEDTNTVDDAVYCKHNFMPVDSTGEILSCINCGILINKKDLKTKNFFDDESNYLNEE